MVPTVGRVVHYGVSSVDKVVARAALIIDVSYKGGSAPVDSEDSYAVTLRVFHPSSSDDTVKGAAYSAPVSGLQKGRWSWPPRV